MNRLTLVAIVCVGLFVASGSAQAQFPQSGRSFTAPNAGSSLYRYSGNSTFNRAGPSFNGLSTFNNFNSFNSFSGVPLGYQGAGAPSVPRYDGVRGLGTVTPLGGTPIIVGGSSFNYPSRFNAAPRSFNGRR